MHTRLQTVVSGVYTGRLVCKRVCQPIVVTFTQGDWFAYRYERLTDNADNSEAGKLSNYHIKTLMLWACELKLNIWWTLLPVLEALPTAG